MLKLGNWAFVLGKLVSFCVQPWGFIWKVQFRFLGLKPSIEDPDSLSCAYTGIYVSCECAGAARLEKGSLGPL